MALGDPNNNIFDPATGQWVDQTAGNRATQVNGQWQWVNPNGQVLNQSSGMWQTPLAAAGSPGAFNYNGGGINPALLNPTYAGASPNGQAGYGGTSAQPGNGGYQAVPGYGYNLLNLGNQYTTQQHQQDFGYQTQENNQQNAAAMELERQREQAAQQAAVQAQQAQQQLADLQARHQMEQQQAHDAFTAQQNQIQQAFDAQQKESDRQLQQKLQQGQIDNQQYMQGRQLAQQESEFARTQALQKAQDDFNNNLSTLKFQQDSQIQNAQLQLSALSEARNERQLQANLAANPKDTVAYEYYMRNLGEPGAVTNSQQGTASQAAWDLAQKFATAKPGDPNAPQQTFSMDSSGGPGGFTARTDNPNGDPNAHTLPEDGLGRPVDPMPGDMGGPNIFHVQSDGPGGTPPPTDPAGYNAPAPSYTDNSLAGMLKSIVSAPQMGAGAGGVGAFGAQIPGANQISRSTYNNMSPTDIGVLTSFLNAGVKGSNGQMVGINPDDYFAQMSKNFVPTLSGGSSGGGMSYGVGSSGTSPFF